MTSAKTVLFPALILLVFLGCNEHTPTRAPQGVGEVAPTVAPVAAPPPPSSSPPSPSSHAADAASSSAAPHALASAGAAAGARGESSQAEEPALLGSDGKPLPQTDAMPRVDSPAFLARIELLVAAIRTDDPKLARSAFFPVVAYEQVKDIQQPARDWERRLLAAFERTIHEYHRSLGEDAATIQFAGIDVPEGASRWMKPGSEGNRIGYHRVLRSHLRVKDARGRAKTFEVTSMISWRGEWYVVHLSGFK